MAERAKPPQHARGERARQRAIALGERREPRLSILDLLVQRTMTA
jgi:hypothetical protein